MFKKKFKYLALLLITAGVTASCIKEEEFPIIPEIEYKDFILIYNPVAGFIDRGVLKFSFKDGDGDIGLKQNETQPPYDYNLFIKYIEIQNGDSVHVITNPISGDTMIFNDRIPILTPPGSDKAIRGDIEDTLVINYNNSEFDTIMFEVYLMDRALHKSNVISTPLIIRN